jgi:hypothetical protein
LRGQGATARVIKRGARDTLFGRRAPPWGEAMVLMEPSFRVDGGVIRITNCHGRGQAIALLVIAAALAVLPLVRPYLPQETYVAFEDGDAGWALWLFGIFACLSAAFWWSTVVIDPKADEVVIRRRWGLFCSEWRRALSSFSAVVIREDDDGRVSVYLEGPAANNGLEINSNKALVWGRDKAEAERIARSVAERLQLGLSIHREPGRPTLHV